MGVRSTRSSSLAATAAAVLLLMACAAPSGRGLATGSRIDWDEPLEVGSFAVRDRAAAAGYLPFTPLRAPSLGPPSRVLVTDPQQVDESHRAFALEYRDPDHGRFYVVQDITQGTQEDLEALGTDPCLPEDGCEGSWSIVTPGDGVRALLVVGPPGTSTSVSWLSARTMIYVMGPPETLTAEAAIEIARRVIEDNLDA